MVKTAGTRNFRIDGVSYQLYMMYDTIYDNKDNGHCTLFESMAIAYGKNIQTSTYYRFSSIIDQNINALNPKFKLNRW